MKFISTLIIGGLMSLASLFGYHEPITQPFGSFNPTAGGTYRLQSSISSTQTTITLTSFKEPVSNIKYTMTGLNSSIEYATIDPQNNTNKEFVSFTGITQNVDNTATLTGVTRGLAFSYPYTASTTLQQAHSGQAIFILSNPPQLTNQYLNMTNGGIVTGLTTFTDPPILTNAATSTSQAASVGYVNGIAFGTGIVPATLGGTGNSSNPLNMILIGNGGSAITSTSSPTVGYITATSTTGTNTFSGNISATATSTINSAIIATTTITSANIASSSISILNAGTVNANLLRGNGAGITGLTIPRYLASGDAGLSVSTAVYATTTLMTVPAGVMNASSTITADIEVNCTNDGTGGNTCQLYLTDATGSPFMSLDLGQTGASVVYSGPIHLVINNNNSASSQIVGIYTSLMRRDAAVVSSNFDTRQTRTINLANQFSLALVVHSNGTHTTAAISTYSIVVNP